MSTQHTASKSLIVLATCVMVLVMSGCDWLDGSSDESTNAAPTASALSITDANGGDAVVGDNLTGGYSYNDAEGDPEQTSTFRWLRDGSAISGATAPSYTIIAADTGATLTFEVTPVASSGTTTGTAVTSTGLFVSNLAPTASALNITDANGGDAVFGDSLTGGYSYNDAEGDPEQTSTFRWLRDGSAISGATAPSYTIIAADTGATLTFEVTPVASSGTTTGTAVTSTGLFVINLAPTASALNITDTNGGTTFVGDSLSGSYSYNDLEADTEGTSTFRWLRDGSAISGATASSYTIIAADSGATLTFEVTPVASTGTTTGTAVTSTGLSVSNSVPTVSTLNIIDANGGAALVGNSLTGTYSYNDVDGDTEGTSTFRWLRDGSAISGATALSYTIIAADSGATLTFEVTPVASAGTTTGTAVTSTGLSVSNSVPTASSVNIADTNGGDAIIGDSFTGSYSYNDADGDTEGTSTFRWLRDGSAISGATSSSYTIASADIRKTITFEVTPVAITGTTTGSAATSSGIAISGATAASVASTIPKTFGFSWIDVGASYYKLQKNPDGLSGFSQVGSNIAGTSVNELISVHQHEWADAQYIIESCDALDSCESSSTLTTAALEIDAIGYIKASVNFNNLEFGAHIDSSSDGAVIAATGSISGAANDIYIYRYDAGSGWSSQIINDIPAGSILSLSLSGNGNVLAVGNSLDEVYIYKYSTAWALEHTIPTPVNSVSFGVSVALSRDGLSLAIGDSGYPTNGAAYVFIDDLDGTWSQRGLLIQASDAATNPGAGFGVTGDAFGRSVALSNDGSTLVVGAEYAETATATDAGQVYVYSWGGASWSEDAILAAQTPLDGGLFGSSLSLSDDGATLAVGRNPEELDGEVHIFRDSGGWALEGSPLTAAAGNGDGFGRSVSLSSDGNTVVIGAHTEDSSGAGINPTPDTGALSSGAAFLFTYGGSSWSQAAFIKAPNPVASDNFGSFVDISGDASTLVIGAPGEDSNSSGINSTYNDDGAADNSGATYLY